MPGLVKKLIVFAVVDGLFLRPSPVDVQPTAIKIEYGTNNITTGACQDAEDPESGLETYGIVGLLNLVTSSYLIAITRREQVASIRHSPIFRIADVTLIPLSSNAEAEKAIRSAQKLLKQGASIHEQADETDAGEDAETGSVNSVTTEPDDARLGPDKLKPEDEAAALEPPKSGVVGTSTSVIKDVIQNKGKYGRFVGKWFGSSGSKLSATNTAADDNVDSARTEMTKERERQVGDAPPDNSKDVEQTKVEAEETTEASSAGRSSTEKKRQSAIEYLTPRIVKTARLYFSSSGFYFSYEHDISTSLATQSTSSAPAPLWERFEPLFFWNRHLITPLIESGANDLILPIMQGFIGQRSFSIAQIDDTATITEADGTELTDLSEIPKTKQVKSNDFLLTLISRRSVKRAGLRYLRRGVDDEGNVANSVETEQILSTQDWTESEKTFSLLQIRGSMPLFFSQSPYSFKPAPIFFGSEATNEAAFKKHFAKLVHRYGKIYAESLVDKHGTEVTIGQAYQDHAEKLNSKGGVDGEQIGFEWFDFHGQCKGMKFENVSILLKTLEPFLKETGYAVTQGGKEPQHQTGVLRTNCMDCLDRTNVVQSAVAGWILEQQLAELDLNINLKTDPKTQWFNILWADNGDAISKQYAGTSALKGDFTRTRKRNWTGALSDFSLTLNRYYNNIFGDYFLQTNIDYFLGAGPHVFDEFETDMTSQDYAIDMSNIRQNAIDTCVKIVLEDPKEQLLHAWTLAAPKQANTLSSHPFEECVLLLTTAALYFCRFDWNTEKVGSFERVDLLDVKEIWRGTFITSALGAAHLDASKNVGFVVRYADRGEGMRRKNTRSMSVVEGVEGEHEHKEDGSKKRPNSPPDTRILAFKALAPKNAASKGAEKETILSESESIKRITDEVRTAAQKAFQKDSGEDAPEVQEHDVVSAADARKSTGYIETLGYSLKKLVWS